MQQSSRDSARHTPLVVLLSAFIAISFGMHYGYFTNQTTYLIAGLRLFDPNFLAHDWFASETAHYHRAYAYLVAALRYLDVLPWGLALLKVAFMSLFGWLLFVIINALAGKRAIWTWLLVVLIFFVFYRTRSVALSYLFDIGGDTTMIGATFLLGAMAAFIFGRYALSGMLLAVAGLFHTNFLLLGLMLFGVAHLLVLYSERHSFAGWPQLIVRGAWQFAPALIVLAFEIPNIINTMGLDLSQDVRAEANRIIIDFRAPHHYKPMTFLGDFISFGGWCVMGLALLPGLTAETDKMRRFGDLFISGLVLVALATVLTTVVFIAPVSRLFVWRLAPFVLMMSQIIVAIAALRPFVDPSSANAPQHWQLMLASFGLVLVLMRDVIHHQLFLPPSRLIFLLACGGLLLGLWALQVWAGKTNALHRFFLRWRRLALPFLVIAIAGIAVLKVNPAYFNLVCANCGDQIHRGLFDWSRGTEPDSLFLVPPTVAGPFRLLAGRAVIVDHGSPPFRPDETIEWFRRMEAVNGGEGSLGAVSVSDLRTDKFYNLLTQEPLDAVVRTYGVDYVVFRRDSQAASLAQDIVFEDENFIVFRPENVK